jgi:leucyl/phenylalanyl-tRNA---protein transferase
MSRPAQSFEITADILLRAYSIGLFPMAESRDSSTLFWVDPKERGIFPLDGLLLSRSLIKTLRLDRFEIRADENFDAVVIACASRENTWINAEIRRLYRELFEEGRAHSIEAFEDGALVGGLYGVSLGAAFFGESMFHLARDASKVALVHLVARLRLGGFRLLDTQFVTPHLASLGAIEVARESYLQMLGQALSVEADFNAWPASCPMRGSEALTHLER